MVNVLQPGYDQDATNPEQATAGFDVPPIRDPNHYGAERILKRVPIESTTKINLEVNVELSPEALEKEAIHLAKVKTQGFEVEMMRTAQLADGKLPIPTPHGADSHEYSLK